MEAIWTNEPVPDGLVAETSVPAKLFKEYFMCNGLLQLYFLQRGMDEFWSYTAKGTSISVELMNYIKQKGVDSLYVARALAYWNMLGRYTYNVEQETIDKYTATDGFDFAVRNTIEALPTCMWFDLTGTDMSKIVPDKCAGGIIVYKDYVFEDNDTESYLELNAMLLATDGEVLQHTVSQYTDENSSSFVSCKYNSSLVEYVVQSFIDKWMKQVGR